MRFSRRAAYCLSLLAVGALVACGGPRSTAPSLAPAQDAPLTVRVRLPVSFAGTSLVVTAYADGARQPASPSASLALTSPGCSVTGNERLCTLAVSAPLGLVDVAVAAKASGGSAGLSGLAHRVEVAPEGGTASLAFDGAPARWAFSPALLAAPADGAQHVVPFAVAAVDADGFTLLAGSPTPPAGVSVKGDMLNQLTITAQGGGLFSAAYSGQAVGDVRVAASAAGAATATASFATLALDPSALEIVPGKTGTVSASLAHYRGGFEATALGSNCSVSPASATPREEGGPVEFSVHLLSAQGCSVRIGPTRLHVPIVIPAKNAVAHPGIGIGPSKIQHIVVLFQENRSFDNIFGGLDQNGKPFPGADTVSNPNSGEPTPHNHLGQPVPMSTGLLEECYDPYHDHPNSVTDVDNGKMDGFDQENVVQESCAPSPAPTNYVYRTMEESEVAPYWQMGEQYAISDRMFEPFSSGSYGPHLYLVSGQSANTIDNPSAGFWGCDNKSPTTVVPIIVDSSGGEAGGAFPCFIVPTLGDEMDQRGVSWRYYATNTTDFGYDWSAYDSFNDIRNGPDWSTKVINPPSQIVTDIGNGTLAQMTWVTPTNNTSDHPQSHMNLGPAWIASVVDAIGQSKFWDTTAIFITWDDWGGWYDHVPPPVTGPVSLGVRVPVIIVSPYARRGFVSHLTHTTGSILHFAEEVFDLPSLGQDDARENDFSDVFNFSQAPTPFTPFAKPHSKAEFMRAESQTQRTPEEERAGD